MATLRAQFNAKQGQKHYLLWRKTVTAKLPEGGTVLLGMRGWSVCPVLGITGDGQLIAPPRFKEAAAKSPTFAAFLKRVVEADLFDPVIYLDEDDNLTFAEYSHVVRSRNLGELAGVDWVCLYRKRGQSGMDNAPRRTALDGSNYLCAQCVKTFSCDGETYQTWRAYFDGQFTYIIFPTPAMPYRRLIAELFAAFPPIKARLHRGKVYYPSYWASD